MKVAFLCHDSNTENGSLFEVGAGYIAKARLERNHGVFFDLDFTPEDVKAKFNEIVSFEGKNEYPTGGSETIMKINENLERI